LYPRQVRLGRIEALAGTVAFLPDDAGPVTLNRTSGAGPVASVAGPAQTLLLLLWGRVGLDHPALRGEDDAAAVRTTLAAALTP